MSRLSLTDSAKEYLEKVGQPNVSLSVKGGGCSGFQYNFSVDTKKEDDDIQYNNILIDKTSADLLKGSEVDFVKELIGEQFRISNPQSKSSCGCGVSFSL